MRRNTRPGGVKADGNKFCVMNRGSRIMHKFLKRQKNRIERKRAKKNPDCVPCYGKYNGYES